MPQPDLLIRPALPAEAPVLSAICRRSKAHWGYDAAFLQAAAPLLAVPESAIRSCRVLVAEIAGSAVGVACLVPLTAGARGWELSHLFIVPERIGLGIGRRLFTAAADLVRANGGGRLEILADPHAAGFYERLGATRIGAMASDLDPRRRLPLYAIDLTRVD